MASKGEPRGFPFFGKSMVLGYADIAIPSGPDALLTYEIPEWAISKAAPGMRVVVPFRRTHTVGIIVRLRKKSPVKRTRLIAELPDDKPLFTPEIIRLLLWLSEYYACPCGDVFRAALPGGFGIDIERIVSVDAEVGDVCNLPKKAAVILEILKQKGDLNEDILKRLVGSNGFFSAIDELRARGSIRIRLETRRKRKPRMIRMVRCAISLDDIQSEIESLRANAIKRLEFLEFLSKHHDSDFKRRDLSEQFGAGVLKTAHMRGWTNEFDLEVYRIPSGAERFPSKTKQITLTDAQKIAVESISGQIGVSNFDVFLLWGVTGSGKTEVYLQAAQETRKAGKGILVLVPEIALTPQLWGQFESRFPGQVAVLHSALRPGERFDAWRRLASGELKIAIGPRSAVFAPIRDLGLIVVDEEHESSYKQDEPPPYYNARDVAIVRGSIEECPVILGSATPSAESYHNAAIGKYKLLELPERVPGAELPGVRIIDMTKEREEAKNFDAFSRELVSKLIETTENGYRAMLLLNRRGFSSYLQCPDCGYIPSCESCGIGLTYHRIDSTLRCHYCGTVMPAPENCPECGSVNIKFRGHGTERIEEELAGIVPKDKIFRLDSDSAKKHGSAKILNDFLASPGSVLVGTQMIAKGHDFPDVALVGVLNADIGLTIPDFRSTERIFQLLNQVAGRAGRSEIRGEVIIQTYRPDSPAIDFAVNGDVKSFFESELLSRKELNYPPFGRLVRVLISGKDPSDVRTASFRLTRELAKIDRNGENYRILGPSSCPLSKLRGEYRWHILLKTERPKLSVAILKKIISKSGKKIKYKIIVDPIKLL